uniref:BTB domain-containing protein n=1 Tax=Chlamydomonas leiostraca TaxID=1034604 RepID=A0A7S0REQ9_9CHLO|mmetsp:Transcript_2066/g.5258  ORF Transcript_2066/g.5258 Transcript_2066/m.5258 type:complete len:248 (+) Transcript_2066:81-824(+)
MDGRGVKRGVDHTESSEIEVYETPLKRARGPDPCSDVSITVVLQDGDRIEAPRAVLALGSPVMAEAMRVEPGCSEIKVMYGSREAWTHIISILHPATTLDGASAAACVASMLPVAHCYAMPKVMAYCRSCTEHLQPSLQAGHPHFVLTWLDLADRYELRELKRRCVACVTEALGAVMQHRHACVYQDGRFKGWSFAVEDARQLAVLLRPSAVAQVPGPRALLQAWSVLIAEYSEDLVTHCSPGFGSL